MSTAAQGGLLQRKSACNGTPGLTGESENGVKSELQRGYTHPLAFVSHSSGLPLIVQPSGQPLAASTRALAGLPIGHDFSKVPVHAADRGVALAPVVQALHGSNSIADDVLRSSSKPLESGICSVFETAFARMPVIRRVDASAEKHAVTRHWRATVHDSPAEKSARYISRKIVAGDASEAAATRCPNFSNVHIHTDEAANRAALAVDARAFKIIRDVYFASGQFNPHSKQGKGLLAHELAHVLQQRGGYTDGRDNWSQQPLIMRETASEGASQSYDEAKWTIYRGIIAGLKETKNTTLGALRGQVSRLPSSLQSAVMTILDIEDSILDLEIQLMLAIIGLAVGFAEGIAGLISGLGRIAWGLLKMTVDWIYALCGQPDAYMQDVNDLLTAIKNIPVGMKRLINDWLERYKRAPLEEQVLMGAELVGQIEAFLATFALAGTTTGKPIPVKLPLVPAVATEGAYGLEKATAVVVTIPAVVPKTAAETAVVASQAMAMSAQGPGGGGNAVTAESKTSSQSSSSGRILSETVVDGKTVIKSEVGLAPGKRLGTERLIPRGVEVGRPGWERAHSQGQITGAESARGIRLAPEEVNQELQRLGIEQFITDLYSQKAADTVITMTTETEAHSGTLALKAIRYRIEAARGGGRSTILYEAEITVENKVANPRITISADQVADETPFLKEIPTGQ